MNKRAKDRFYTLWTGTILLCLLASLLAACVPSCTKVPDSLRAAEATPTPKITPAPGDEEDVQEEAVVTPEPVVTTLAETEDAGSLYVDKCIFLGDSTIYSLTQTGVLPNTQVWAAGTAAMSLADLDAISVVYSLSDGSAQSYSIADAAARRKPEYLVITLGLDDLNTLSETEFKTQYTALIDLIQKNSPDTNILCQSLFPVVDSLAPDGMDNRTINVANAWILAVAEETGTRYLDTNSALTDSSGGLKAEYSSEDGIHLSQAGGEAVLTYLRTHAYQ